jgi:CMP/dCMP kinase
MQSNSIPVIAIDGPSASGKGTVAQLVAQKLGFYYLDSGALYRIVALGAHQANIDWNDANACGNLAKTLQIHFGQDQVFLNNVEISEHIRQEKMGEGASIVAQHQTVRAALLDLQHHLRQAPGLVADGRDMASVVFPDAALKIFLTASVETRAERRFNQYKNKGLTANFKQIYEDLKQRDLRDSERKNCPLMQTPDALLLDTTEHNIEQAVSFVIDAYQKI